MLEKLRDISWQAFSSQNITDRPLSERDFWVRTAVSIAGLSLGLAEVLTSPLLIPPVDIVTLPEALSLSAKLATSFTLSLATILASGNLFLRTISHRYYGQH